MKNPTTDKPNILKAMLHVLLKEMGFRFYIWISVLMAVGGFAYWHNWNLNTPQRLSDPFNWLMMIFVVIWYLIAKRMKILM